METEAWGCEKFFCSIDKARNNLGYDVKVSFDAGLSKLAL